MPEFIDFRCKIRQEATRIRRKKKESEFVIVAHVKYPTIFNSDDNM